MAEPLRAPRPGSTRDRDAPARTWIARSFTLVEDVVYVGLAVLLAGMALVLLVAGAVTFAQLLVAGTLPESIVELLDRILLILMIVEILYTVQLSFREHTLVPEPFLIVGLIAVTRRVLVLTAEFATILEAGEVTFRSAMVELAILTVMIVALVGSIVLLRRRASSIIADR